MLHKGADHTTIAMHDQPARKPLSSGVNRVTYLAFHAFQMRSLSNHRRSRQRHVGAPVSGS